MYILAFGDEDMEAIKQLATSIGISESMLLLGTLTYFVYAKINHLPGTDAVLNAMHAIETKHGKPFPPMKVEGKQN